MTAQGETVVARRHDALTFVPTDGSDVIVFDPATGQTHRLGGAASEIWTAIDGVKSIAEIVDAVIKCAEGFCDSALFVEWWERKAKRADLCRADMWNSRARLHAQDVLRERLTADHIPQERRVKFVGATQPRGPLDKKRWNILRPDDSTL